MLLLARASRQPEFWSNVRQAADQTGFASSLPNLLYLIENLLNTTLPNRPTARLSEGSTVPLSASLLRDGCQRALATASTSKTESLNFASFIRAKSSSARWAMLRSRLLPNPQEVAQACGIPNTARVWLHYPGYIAARACRLLQLLAAALFPRWRKARLAEGDAELDFTAAFGPSPPPAVT